MKIRTCIIAASLVLFSAPLVLGNNQPAPVSAEKTPAAEIIPSTNAAEVRVPETAAEVRVPETATEVRVPETATEVRVPETAGPSALVPEAAFTFEEVLEGEETLHDFIVQNKGTAPLRIERVRTG